MEKSDLEKLLGGYATNTLTHEERQALFDAALHDQTLFNTLADEQALKELLENPQHRQQLLRALQQSQPQSQPQAGANWLSQVLAWTQQSSNIAIAGSVVVALLAFTFVVRLIDDVGPVPSSLESKREVKPPAPVSKPVPLQPTEPITSVTPATPSVPPNDQPLAPSDTKSSSSTSLEASPQTPVPPAPSLMAKRKIRAFPERATEEFLDEADRGSADIPLPALSEKDGPTAKDRLSPQNGWRISARELFYQTTSKMGTGQQSKEGQRQALGRLRLESKASLKSLPPNEAETLEQFTDYSTQPSDQETPAAQLEASQPESQRVQSSDPPKEESTVDVLPLGLRYSILQQQPDETFSEVDISTPLASTDTVRLTVETNQPGFLYVLTAVGQQWQILFPLRSEGRHQEKSSALVKGRTRYTLPETSGFNIEENQSRSHWALLFSREPLPNVHKMGPSLTFPKTSFQSDHKSEKVFIENVNERLKNGATEHAVYIIDDAAQPSAYLLADFTLQYR